MKASSKNTPHPALDRPLEAGAALLADKLDREAFARAAAAAVRKANGSNGLVISIEGPWGSGKTSTLAMVEDLLGGESEASSVVRFNPWLIGDRDSLLRHFLAKLAEAAKLTDGAKAGKKAAKELKSYAKVFDVLRIIPGAEPWASIIKSVVESVGDATDSIAEYKTPDIELQKTRVEDALRKLDHPIVVFVDDIDRLFPLEVFEMIRIIKAVGDLPNVAYVVAWDPKYVISALAAASVPQSGEYLDKIVQIRMPLPSLSTMARNRLINDAIATLDGDATADYFPNSNDRLSALYYSGLREMLEQPRDFVRVFNTVEAIEPALRGEVVFADIVGLAALMVKAPEVFALLRRSPRWFVGMLPGDSSLLKNAEKWLEEGSAPREAAIDKSAAPEATRVLLKRLFPATTATKGSFSFIRVVDVEGHIAAPARLAIALQMSVSGADVSFIKARRYLLRPDERASIEATITDRNCLEFLECLGDIGKSSDSKYIQDLSDLSLSIARLVDTPAFTLRAKDRSDFWSINTVGVAETAIEALVEVTAPERGQAIAALIVEDEHALSLGIHLLVRSYLNDDDPKDVVLFCARPAKAPLLRKFARNMTAAAREGRLLTTADPSFLLWNLARFSKAECPKLFEEIRNQDPSLDEFALAIFKRGFDTNKGQTYQVSSDATCFEAYGPLAMFKEHAKKRLADTTLGYPGRAAWEGSSRGQDRLWSRRLVLRSLALDSTAALLRAKISR